MTNFRLFQTQNSLQTTTPDLMKMAESSPNEWENTEEKGKIARNEQFLLFPPYFQKTCIGDT